MKILITGATGSIGKEIVEQLIKDNELILFDRNEEKAFYLEKELREKYPKSKFHICLGSITDGHRVREVLTQHQPYTVYHTAANKHVPLGESNVEEFVYNNMWGTINMVCQSTLCGVKTFVFISTDKATYPESVMGMTKRLCEKYILGISPRYTTKFIICRFGNIIGSSGSVYEIFEKQSKEGKITVTHPDMERYFIEKEKAVRHLINCSRMESGLYIFDMGAPVKIMDVAKSFNCPIEITGLRPGEKIEERLLYDYEDTRTTIYHDILKVTSLYNYSSDVLDIYLLASEKSITKEELKKLTK